MEGGGQALSGSCHEICAVLCAVLCACMHEWVGGCACACMRAAGAPCAPVFELPALPLSPLFAILTAVCVSPTERFAAPPSQLNQSISQSSTHPPLSSPRPIASHKACQRANPLTQSQQRQQQSQAAKPAARPHRPRSQTRQGREGKMQKRDRLRMMKTKRRKILKMEGG